MFASTWRFEDCPLDTLLYTRNRPRGIPSSAYLCLDSVIDVGADGFVDGPRPLCNLTLQADVCVVQVPVITQACQRRLPIRTAGPMC